MSRAGAGITYADAAHGQGEEAKCACSSSTSKCYKLPLRISDLRCRSTRFYHKIGGVKTVGFLSNMGQGWLWHYQRISKNSSRCHKSELQTVCVAMHYRNGWGLVLFRKRRHLWEVWRSWTMMVYYLATLKNDSFLPLSLYTDGAWSTYWESLTYKNF